MIEVETKILSVEDHQAIAECTNAAATQIIQAGEGGAAENNLRREGIHRDQPRAKAFQITIRNGQYCFSNAPREVS